MNLDYYQMDEDKCSLLDYGNLTLVIYMLVTVMIYIQSLSFINKRTLCVCARHISMLIMFL